MQAQFLICDSELEQVSGTHWTALACLTREFHPLRVSQVALSACDGSRPHRGRFNARTETRQSYLPNMRVIASRPATACLCADGCSPYTSLLIVGSRPAHSRTAFLSDAYRTYPMDLFNFRTVASPHRPIGRTAGLCQLAAGVKS